MWRVGNPLAIMRYSCFIVCFQPRASLYQPLIKDKQCRNCVALFSEAPNDPCGDAHMSHERPPAHTVTNSDDLVQQGQLCLIGFSTPNRRGGSCGGLGPNPNSPTKQGIKIGHSVRGDVLCVVSLVGRHSTCEVSACPPTLWMKGHKLPQLSRKLEA